MLPITSLVAALAALFLVGLSLSVSLRRRTVGTDIGTGTDTGLLRRIRAQGNFTEYVPLALILLGLAETRGVAPGLLWTIGALILAGRACHAAGILSGRLPLRIAGMIGTYGSLIVGAATLLL